jgi:hypothetical protein
MARLENGCLAMVNNQLEIIFVKNNGQILHNILHQVCKSMISMISMISAAY